MRSPRAAFGQLLRYRGGAISPVHVVYALYPIHQMLSTCHKNGQKPQHIGWDVKIGPSMGPVSKVVYRDVLTGLQGIRL